MIDLIEDLSKCKTGSFAKIKAKNDSLTLLQIIYQINHIINNKKITNYTYDVGMYLHYSNSNGGFETWYFFTIIVHNFGVVWTQLIAKFNGLVDDESQPPVQNQFQSHDDLNH